jgi:alpha-galactosidase
MREVSRWRERNDTSMREMLDGTREIPYTRSHEYGSVIVEAMTMRRPAVIYGNVRNSGLIDNLPDGYVEVVCLVDQNGVQPCHFGSLPEQLAGLNRTHMTVHSLMCDALLKHEKEAARYALMLDPLTAAVCSPAEVSALFDEIWEAELLYLQYFE